MNHASCSRVTHAFDDAGARVVALDDVSVAVRAGELLLVMGPSGSGKSTLLSVLAGLLAPTKGAVSLCGSPLISLDAEGRARVRRENVGFVFQSFHLFGALTARENVECVLDLKGVPRGRQVDLAARALAFIAKNAFSPLSLEDVARAVGRNRSHVADVVRRETGLTVGQLISALRLDEARRRLEETDELVEVIGERVGYTDATHFARMFKRRFGAAPRAWRTAQRTRAT